METIEQLKAKKAALEAKKLEKEIAALEVEVITPATVEQKHAQLADAARNGGNQDKVVEGIVELKAQVERLQKEKAPTFKGKFISSEVTKAFGAEGNEVGAKAEDLAHHMLSFDMVSQLTGTPIYKLNRFQKLFGNIGQAGFEKLYGAIQMQHKIMDPSGESSWVATDTNLAAAMHILKAKSLSKVCTVFTAPSNPFNWPISTNNSNEAAVKSTYGTSVTAADTGVSRMQFDAKTLQRVAELADELGEDGAFAVGPVIMAQLFDKLGDMLDRAGYFGDESSANPSLNINDVKAAALTTAGGYQLMDGIVKACRTNSQTASIAAAASERAAILVILAKLSYGGIDPSVLNLVMNPTGYFKLLAEMDDLSKFGSAAGIVSGSVNSIFGMPVFLTSGIPLTDANGVVDGDTAGNNVKTSALIVNKQKVYLDLFRAPKAAEEIYAVSGKRILGVSLRADIQVQEALAAAYGYARA